MRILMWFTIGFAAACALSIYLGIGIWICALIIPAAVAILAIKEKKMNPVAVVLLGITAGMLWMTAYNSFYLNTARDCDGKTLPAVAIVSDYSYETTYGVAADGKTELDGKSFRVRIYYPQKIPLKPGDRIEGKFRFRLTTDDSAQGGTYHQGEGIFLLAYVDKDSVITNSYIDESEFFGAYWRRKITDLLEKVFPADTLGFAQALLLGDSSLLDYKTDTDFKLSGIRHIIAVSGLHVSILMSLVYVFTARKRYLSAIIGIPVLILFAAIVGFTPSVVRACIMQALMLLALFFNQEYDPPSALAFAVLAMLSVNPMLIVSVAFQLSCGCIVGIFLFYERVNGFMLKVLKVPKGKSRKAKLIRWFSGSVSITLSTMVTTTPFSAIYFGTVSIVGLVTNLLTLWIVSFIFFGIVFTCVAGCLWIPLGKLIAHVVSIPVRFVMFTAKLLAGIPFSAVYTCSIYIVLWLVLCYVLFAVFLKSKQKKPWVLACCAACMLVLAVALSWLEKGGENYKITVFDVGQGQSILVECDGKRYLIDCGGDSERFAADVVSHHLLSRGITHLDGVFLTHYDKDHAGGVPLLLTAIDAEILYLPDIDDENEIRNTLAQSGRTVYWIDRLVELNFGMMKFTLIPGSHRTLDNERSLCILFQTINCDILITGDRSTAGESALLKDLKLPELELLVVGHHGSASATGLELLTATMPKKAVISVGENNSYNHPSEDVLYRLKLFRCSIWRTDLDGTIVFKG